MTRESILGNAENLRAFGADFDYTDRTDYLLVRAPNAIQYLQRHDAAMLGITGNGSTVQHELAIRDMAIDFFKGELESLSAKAIAFFVAFDLTKLFQEAGVEVPDEAKIKVAQLMHALKAAVMPEGSLIDA